MKKNTCTARLARHYEPENGVFLSLDPDGKAIGDGWRSTPDSRLMTRIRHISQARVGKAPPGL